MPPGLSMLGTVLRLALQEPALRHLLTRLGEDSPTMRSVLNLDPCEHDTIGPCRAWWPAWPGRPVTTRRCMDCRFGMMTLPTAHEMRKGKGIKGKRWERRRTLNRRAERNAARRAGHRLGVRRMPGGGVSWKSPTPSWREGR